MRAGHRTRRMIVSCVRSGPRSHKLDAVATRPHRRAFGGYIVSGPGRTYRRDTQASNGHWRAERRQRGTRVAPASDAISPRSPKDRRERRRSRPPVVNYYGRSIPVFLCRPWVGEPCHRRRPNVIGGFEGVYRTNTRSHSVLVHERNMAADRNQSASTGSSDNFRIRYWEEETTTILIVGANPPFRPVRRPLE